MGHLQHYMRRVWRENDGFSFVEMLVATAMLAILTLSLFGTILTARLQKKTAHEVGESFQAMRFAAARFAEDIRYQANTNVTCPDDSTLQVQLRTSPFTVLLTYQLVPDPDVPMKLRLHRITPTTDEVLADDLWGDPANFDFRGAWFSCSNNPAKVEMRLAVLDPSKKVEDRFNPPEGTLYVMSTKAAVRRSS